MEGRYVESRAIGDFVYVLVRNDNAVAPPPEQNEEGVYETQEEYLARFAANPVVFVDACAAELLEGRAGRRVGQERFDERSGRDFSTACA